MITKEKNVFSPYQIILTNSLRKCLEISQENLSMDIGKGEELPTIFQKVLRSNKERYKR